MRAAPPSRRSGHRPGPPSATRGCRLRRRTATGSARSMPPATSVTYSAIAAATTPAAADTTAPSAPTALSATPFSSDAGGPGVDGLDGQRRGHRLPGGAVPGCGLHHLRAGRDTDRDHLQRHRSHREHHLPLPGPRGRRRRQSQRLLLDRHSDDTRGGRHHGAHRAHGALGDAVQRDAGGPGVDGLDRQRRGQPATGWSGARVRAAPPSRRWRRRPATTFSDTGLSASTTYRYRVRAVDAAGNLSSLFRRSPRRRRRRRRTRRRRRPRPGCRRRAFSATQVDLRWTASTDNVGRHRLPGGAVPGRGLHDLRPGRRHRPGPPSATPGLSRDHHLPLPGPRGRRRRQSQRLLHRSPLRRHPRRRTRRRRRAPTALTATAVQRHPGRPGLDGLDRQRRGQPATGSSAARVRAAPPSPQVADADRRPLQRHGAVGFDDVPLPGPRGRCGRQPERLLHRRHGDDAGRE